MDTRNFVGPKATVLFVTLITASGREAEARLAVSSHILSDIVLNPGRNRFRHGQAWPAGLSGPDDRADQPSRLAVHAHGFCHSIALRPARRDRS